MRRGFSAIRAAVAAAALLACTFAAQAQTQSQAPTTYKIGVMGGLSGLGAQIGQWTVEGAKAGAAVVNAANGPVRLEVIAEDMQWNPQKAVEAFNKLVNVDHVAAAMSGGSAAMQAIAPLADQDKLVLLNIGAQAPTMAGIGKYVFSVLQLANYDVAVLADYAYNKLNLRKVALFYVSDDTGKFDQAEFDRDFTKLGGTITARESFRPSETNYGAQVAKIAASRPDAVYLVGQPSDLPFAVRQLRATMPNTQIISYAGLESQEFLKAAGNAGNGIVYTTTYFDPASSDPEVKTFVEAYRKLYGTTPESPYIGYGYDGIRILAAGLAEAKEPGEKLRDVIARTKRYPGVTGQVVFQPDGTVAKAIAVKQVKDGKFETIAVVQPQS
jgi:branched-chain amino acid transport system substrate-binding protein